MERLIPIVGLLALGGVAVLMSENRKAINWKTVFICFLIHTALFELVFHVPYTKAMFAAMGTGVEKLLYYSLEGPAFLLSPELAHGPFKFIIRVGAAIVFVAALSALLYRLGIMQWVVRIAAKALAKSTGISGPEAVSAIGAIFFGQVECQLLIKPFLAKLSRSALFCSLVTAMATISGSALVAYTGMGMNATHLIAASIMAAPAGIAFAKIMCPDLTKVAVAENIEVGGLDAGVNVIDAMAIGAMDGAKIAGHVMIMVGVAVAFVALLNGILAGTIGHFGLAWTVQDIFGVFFTPIAFMCGVPWHEAFHVGRLMATEIIVNEFSAYGELTKVIAGNGAYVLSEKTQVVATMALCGFANLGSIAINIGGLGAMAPERRSEIAQIAFRALIAANFATWSAAMTAAVLY